MPSAAVAVWTYITAHAVEIIVMAALSYYSYTAAQNAMRNAGDSVDQGQLINTCNNRIPLPLIYGRQRVGINRVFACVTGDDNKYLHVVGNVCEGPIEGIYEEYGVPQLFLGDKIYTDYGDKFTYAFYTGTSTQTADSDLSSATSGEDNPWSDPKHYMAYIYCRFEYDPEVFQGLPEITMIVEGMKCYNPDTDVTEYTRNPALHCLDFLTRSSRRGGMGISSSRIDLDLINSAASYCTTKSWNCDICLRTEGAAVDHFGRLLATFRGSMIYSDSIFQIKYRDLNYESTVMDLTEGDVIEQGVSTLKIKQPSIFDTPNTIRCRFVNEDKNYVADDYVFEDPDAISEDGDVREMAIDLSGIIEPTNVARMACYLLERARVNKQASLAAGTRAMALEPHDLVTLSHSWPGWEEKILRVSGVSLSQNGEVGLQLQEEDSNFYDDSYTITEETYFDTNLPDPRGSVASVINVSDSEETYYYRGRTFTRWRIDFERPDLKDYPFFDYAEIWVRIGAAGSWAFATRSDGDYVIDPVEEGEYYEVNIVSVSIFGTKQAFDDGYKISTTVTGQDQTPANVTGMVAVAAGDSVTIMADELTEPDIFGYEVRLGESWDGALKVGFNETPNFRLTGVRPGTHTFWLAALSNNGNYSSTPASDQVTVFYPPGYADIPTYGTWSWDYSTGTHDNTEQHTYSSVDCLRCAHTSDVLTGNWTSPEYDLGAKQSVRIWGDFLTHLYSSEMLWSAVFGSGDLWSDKLESEDHWYDVFSPTTTGNLSARLYYGDTSGSLTEYVDNFQLFSPEIEARYIKVVIYITDPALATHFYVEELSMHAAWWS